MTAVIVLVVLAGLAAWMFTGFNGLRAADVRAQEALGGIDVQLTRRADLIPNLVESVKGYMGHERGVLESVTNARTAVAAAAKSASVPEKAAAEAQLEKALVNVMAVSENYPDLKASANFVELQRQLTDTENQLAFARQYYNDAVATLNTKTRTLPTLWLTGMANVHQREFYQAPDANVAPPQVGF